MLVGVAMVRDAVRVRRHNRVVPVSDVRQETEVFDQHVSRKIQSPQEEGRMGE
jgi:hypothetical protein